MKHNGLRFVPVFFLLVFFSFSIYAQKTLEEGFSIFPVGSGWSSPVGLVSDDNGRVYVWERSGRVYLYENDEKLPNPLIDIREEVSTFGELGLMSLALDPNFEQNGYYYLLYSVDKYHLLNYGEPWYNPSLSLVAHATIGRITRFTADSSTNFTTTLPNSRKVLLGDAAENGIPLLYNSHGVGTIAFGDDGSLFASAGDGSTWKAPYAGNGPPFFEELVNDALTTNVIQPKEEIGSYRSQLVDNLNGKILRIHPETGEGYPNNPFYDPLNPNNNQSKVWALGLRNPYRFAVKPNSGTPSPNDNLPGVLFVADVGEGTWEEMNIIDKPGLNCGWPVFEGIEVIPAYEELTAYNEDAPNPLFGNSNCDEPFYAFQDLIKQPSQPSTPLFNPCDPSVEISDDLTFEHHRPDLTWRHISGEVYYPDFDEEGNPISVETTSENSTIESEKYVGSAATGGDFYQGLTFPEEYQGQFFFCDYKGWVNLMEVDLNNDIHRITPFYRDSFFLIHVHSNVSDGCLYVIQYPNTIFKICYGENSPPIAVAEADQFYGPSPLTVQFTGSNSFDPTNDSLTYLWDFGNGNTSESPNPTFTFEAGDLDPVFFEVSLTVTDTAGNTDQESINVSLNNTPPIVEISSFEDGALYPMGGVSIYPLEAEITDLEESPQDLRYEWKTFLHHNTHYHENSTDTSILAEAKIVPAGCDDEQYFYRVRLDVFDSYGLSGSDEHWLYPDCSPPFVDLLFFIANSDGAGVKVDWETSSEINLNRFVVQRSADNRFWQNIGTVDRKGNSEGDIYSFYDDDPIQDQQSYYRLALISESDIWIYSNEESVYFKFYEDLIIRPNPVTDQIIFLFQNIQEKVDINVYTENGIMVHSQSFSSSYDGPEEVTVFLPQDLSNGIYFYKVKTGELEKSGKFFLLK